MSTDQQKGGGLAGDMLFYPFGQEWQYDNGVNAPWWQFYNSFSRFNADLGFDLTPNRKYSPTLGRWMTPDPSGMAAASPSNPQTWNMYAYVLNNPTSLIDTSGLDPCPDSVKSADPHATWVCAKAPPSIPMSIVSLTNLELSNEMNGPVTTAVGAGGGGAASGGSTAATSSSHCHGGMEGISPQQGQEILNASKQYFGRPYSAQECNQFVCNSINATHILPHNILVTAHPGHYAISSSPNFATVPASQRQAADVMVFSNPAPYHMGFYVPHPPMPPALNLYETFLSATEHGGIGNLGGPRYLRPVPTNFAGSKTYYRLQVPCS